MRSNRLVIWAACLFFGLTACHKRAGVNVPAITALPPASVTALANADREFTAGNYAEAGQEYERYLELAPSGGQRDQALFRLGLTYGLRQNPAPDWQRATTVLRELIQEYPDSPLKVPATVILSLRSEIDQMASNTAATTKQRDDRIRQLTTELERLKRIDADRKRGGR